MKLGIILTILAMPICAQATICEQFLSIRELIRDSRAEAAKEWKARPWFRKAGDWIAGTQAPEGVLVLEGNKITKQIAGHFDHIIPLGNDQFRLVRYSSAARDEFEKHPKFESTRIERLNTYYEYLLHLMPDASRAAYLSGRIINMNESGMTFLDYGTRTLHRIESEEFISAKSVDIGDRNGSKLAPTPNDEKTLWVAGSGRSLKDLLIEKRSTSEKLVLQVMKGVSYGIQQFHNVPLTDLSSVQIVAGGIFVPELGITVAIDQVVVVSAL